MSCKNDHIPVPSYMMFKKYYPKFKNILSFLVLLDNDGIKLKFNYKSS